MKFSEEHDEQPFTITGYDEQTIRINDQEITQGLIVAADHFNANWQPKVFAELKPQHLEAVFMLQPEIILLGTGREQIFPEKEVYLSLIRSTIGFEIMNTQAACRTFSILTADNRKVAAALFCN
jgi:uncharacterized protein